MTLPHILKKYFEASNRFHIDDCSDCFTPDAFVHDEEQDYVGRDAIRDWIELITKNYHPKFEVTRTQVSGPKVLLTVAVSGNFSGSPAKLDYDVTLHDGKISRMIIE